MTIIFDFIFTGLFHKFILQSASALCDWSIEKSPLEYALKVADGKHQTCMNTTIICLTDFE
jgi:hypothetical protein